MASEKNIQNTDRRTALRFGAATLTTVAVSGLAPSSAFAADDLIYTGFFSNKALSGYDPVAYFTEAKPVKGKRAYTMEYQGADWYFASQMNLDTFKSDPEKYVPQYGGYCAYAVGIGQTASGDPDHWDIVDGKLYINYDANTQNLWKKDIPGYIKTADENWPNVVR